MDQKRLVANWRSLGIECDHLIVTCINTLQGSKRPLPAFIAFYYWWAFCYFKFLEQTASCGTFFFSILMTDGLFWSKSKGRDNVHLCSLPENLLSKSILIISRVVQKVMSPFGAWETIQIPFFWPKAIVSKKNMYECVRTVTLGQEERTF